MTQGLEKPARGGRAWALGTAILGLAALAPVQGGAAPFRIVTDAANSVWVLDAGSGELTWCQVKAPAGPRVIDMFGPNSQVRDVPARPSVADCAVAWRPTPSEDGTVRLSRFGYGSGYGYGMPGGYGAGYGYGAGAVDISDGQVLIVRPKRININLY
jgi:hypothetical protein